MKKDQTDDRFYNLGQLLGAWFHQDWDVKPGETTLEEVIAEFKDETSQSYQDETRIEIAEYLAEHPDDNELEDHMERTFHQQIERGTFGTARQFLTKVSDLLSTPREKPRRAS